MSIGLDLNKSSPRWRIVEKSEANANFATVSMKALEKQNLIWFLLAEKKEWKKGMDLKIIIIIYYIFNYFILYIVIHFSYK